MTENVTGKLFQAKDYAKAVKHKEETGGILVRWIHPSLGVVYEVKYIPSGEPDKKSYEYWLSEFHKLRAKHSSTDESK